MSKIKVYKQAESLALVHMSYGANVTQAVAKVMDHFNPDPDHQQLDITDSLRLTKDLSAMCPHKA